MNLKEITEDLLKSYIEVTIEILLECLGHGRRVVKVSNRGWPCPEFKPSTTKDSPCSCAMHVKFVESSDVFPLMWCGT
ncbi:hypothetical protein TNCV_4763571 [Trichonephila clavipes]|nr:hypothetical protein TNCV_4763571 [Trichonephila clavipes]